VAQVELLELWHPREQPKTLIGDRTRPAEIEPGDVFQLRDASKCPICHLPAGIER